MNPVHLARMLHIDPTMIFLFRSGIGCTHSQKYGIMGFIYPVLPHGLCIYSLLTVIGVRSIYLEQEGIIGDFEAGYKTSFTYTYAF